MFIAIQWTFRDSGSLLSRHSSHLGVTVNVGEHPPRSVHITWWRIGSSVGPFLSACFLPSLNYEFTSYNSNLGGAPEHFFCVGNSHFGSPPNDLNAAVSWDHWTILEVDIRQYSPLNHVPIPPKWRNHSRKSATVLKYVIQTIKQKTEKQEKKESTHFTFTIVTKLIEHSRQLGLWITQKSYPNQ